MMEVYWDREIFDVVRFEATVDRVVFVRDRKELESTDPVLVGALSFHGVGEVEMLITASGVDDEVKSLEVSSSKICSLGNRRPIKSDMVLSAAIDRWDAAPSDSIREFEVDEEVSLKIKEVLQEWIQLADTGEPWRE